MNNFKMLAACAAVLFPASGASAATVINFDQSPAGVIAPGTNVTNEYASLGVTFSLLENGSVVANSAFADDEFVGGAGSNNGLFNVVGGIFTNRADVLRITFAGLASGISFATEGFGDRTTFQAFGSNGALLESFTNVGGDAAIVSFASSGVARIDALQSLDDFTYRIDNLSFEPAAMGAVPEPATWAMMLLGFGAVGYSMRRRRKVTAQLSYSV